MTKNQKTAKLEDWLPQFFEEYQTCRKVKELPLSKPLVTRINYQNLDAWFCSMKQPLVDARSGAFQCDPWEIAGLGRDEVRNSSVLAWLLNPRGSHGLGEGALTGLLGILNQYFRTGFPIKTGRFCSVKTEVNPNGEISNRVDIEIDSENFYLLIEVKIDATEGKMQLKRYGDLTELNTQNSNRPWAIVLLTPDGYESKTADNHASKVLSISWHELSLVLEKSVVSAIQKNHDAKGASRIMAEQIVRRFLKRIQTF